MVTVPEPEMPMTVPQNPPFGAASAAPHTRLKMTAGDDSDFQVTRLRDDLRRCSNVPEAARRRQKTE